MWRVGKGSRIFVGWRSFLSHEPLHRWPVTPLRRVVSNLLAPPATSSNWKKLLMLVYYHPIVIIKMNNQTSIIHHPSTEIQTNGNPMCYSTVRSFFCSNTLPSRSCFCWSHTRNLLSTPPRRPSREVHGECRCEVSPCKQTSHLWSIWVESRRVADWPHVCWVMHRDWDPLPERSPGRLTSLNRINSHLNIGENVPSQTQKSCVPWRIAI